MSMSVSRQIFSRVFTNANRKKYLKCFASVRLKHSCENSSELKDPSGIESAVLKNFSEPLVIERIDPPKRLQPTEVLIDVNYCALNGPDILACENLYSYKPHLPFIPGYEISGKLLEISEGAKKAGYNVGDKVVALNKDRFGGIAERCVAEINDVWKIPASVKSIDAVCLMENYMTALIALEKFGSISEEDMVLVNVGIGGVGLAAVDIASNVFRAQVIGVGFSEDRADKIRERGAFQAIAYKEKKLLKQIKEIAEEHNIKDVFEGDSGKHFKKVLNSFMNVYKSKTPSKNLFREDNFGVVVQHLSREGRLIIAGVADIKTDEDEDNNDSEKFVVTGIDLRDYRKRKQDLYRQTGDDVISFIEEGLIKPAPSMIAGLYNINDAFKFVYEMKACGKVLIDLKQKNAKAEVQ